jgi:hypothetical protein
MPFDTFWIVYAASAPEGLDTVDAAIVDSLKAHPLSGPTFSSMTDYSAHRDELAKDRASTRKSRGCFSVSAGGKLQRTVRGRA